MKIAIVCYPTFGGSGVLATESMDLIYNIGDAVNKIGFGLVIYALAVNASKEEAAA